MVIRMVVEEGGGSGEGEEEGGEEEEEDPFVLLRFVVLAKGRISVVPEEHGLAVARPGKETQSKAVSVLVLDAPDVVDGDGDRVEAEWVYDGDADLVLRLVDSPRASLLFPLSITQPAQAHP